MFTLSLKKTLSMPDINIHFFSNAHGNTQIQRHVKVKILIHNIYKKQKYMYIAMQLQSYKSIVKIYIGRYIICLLYVADRYIN